MDGARSAEREEGSVRVVVDMVVGRGFRGVSRGPLRRGPAARNPPRPKR
jgi:NAD(P)H-hydrate repair Nnr-like enzyme with NAD(P)H-hydrate epimerase domain